MTLRFRSESVFGSALVQTRQVDAGFEQRSVDKTARLDQASR